MDAWRKHAMKHSDDLHPEKITSNIAENALNTNICQKYNDGKIYDFKSFDLHNIFTGEKQVIESDTDNFTYNFINVLKNFMIKNSTVFPKGLRPIILPLKYGMHLIIGNYRFLEWDFCTMDIDNWFLQNQVFQFLYCESSSEITFNIKLNYNSDNIQDDFHRVNGQSSTDSNFEIIQLKSDERHIDSFKLYKILKKTKFVCDFEKFLLSDNFKVFYNILKDIVNIQLYIIKANKKIMKIVITAKNSDSDNVTFDEYKNAYYFHEYGNFKNRFEFSAYHSVTDILNTNSINKSPMVFSPVGSNGGNRNIIHHIFNICTANPDSKQTFLDRRDFLEWKKEDEPYVSFIIDVFKENGIIMENGNIPICMNDFTGLDFSSFLYKPFHCSKSLIKLCASGNVKEQYINFTNFVEYHGM